ncbi:hypothetical protein OFEAOIEE_LOCUS5097 [Methylorubrum extorquens]
MLEGLIYNHHGGSCAIFTILGTNGDNVLNGTLQDDVILDLLGNDVITDPGGFNRIDGQD